jgi:SAM-dependent methyltransferase
MERRRGGGTPSSTGPRESPAQRFARLDPYRAEREWKRYEGTPQRDLFRELRRRFLVRHARDAPWVLDVGCGPGRFTPFVGGPKSRRIALDLSLAMLRQMLAQWNSRDASSPIPDRLRADGRRPPLPPGQFGEVAILGNALGFAEERSEELLAACESLVAPGGTFVVEIAPGPGERSRYLARLPPAAVSRLLDAPIRALRPRIEREGFATERVRRKGSRFRRWTAPALLHRWRARGWQVEEVLAVAPVLGPDLRRVSAVAGRGKAWSHLMELEEEIGREAARWPAAAAVLAAVRFENRTATF